MAYIPRFTLKFPKLYSKSQIRLSGFSQLSAKRLSAQYGASSFSSVQYSTGKRGKPFRHPKKRLTRAKAHMNVLISCHDYMWIPRQRPKRNWPVGSDSKSTHTKAHSAWRGERRLRLGAKLKKIHGMPFFEISKPSARSLLNVSFQWAKQKDAVFFFAPRGSAGFMLLDLLPDLHGLYAQIFRKENRRFHRKTIVRFGFCRSSFKKNAAAKHGISNPCPCQILRDLNVRGGRNQVAKTMKSTAGPGTSGVVDSFWLDSFDGSQIWSN